MRRYISIQENNYNIEQKYKLFNKLYFNSKLPGINIILVNKKAKFIAQVCYDKKEKLSHLEINRYFKDLSENNKDAVLLHEMIHIWVYIQNMSSSKNLHRGEFLKKAKEIESKIKLNISGRFHKDSDDLEKKYSDKEKIEIYVIFKTYTPKFLKKNVESMDFYSNLDKAEEIGRNLAKNNYFSHIYKIVANSPIIDYNIIKKYIDTSKGWLVFKDNFVKNIIQNIKDYPKYSELIKII